MKKPMKWMLGLVVAVFLFPGCKADAQNEGSQERDEQAEHDIRPPQKVLAAFDAAYADAEEVEWQKDGDNFEVEFENNEVVFSVVYDANGTALETESEISHTALPTKAMTYIQEHYEAFQIEKAEKSESREGIVYEVLIENKAENTLEVVFDQTGTFVKMEQVNNKEEGEAGDEDGEHDEDDG